MIEAPKYIIVGPEVKAAFDEAVREETLSRHPVLREALRQYARLQKDLRASSARR